jgi:hypothetical protein
LQRGVGKIDLAIRQLADDLECRAGVSHAVIPTKSAGRVLTPPREVCKHESYTL